MSRSPTSKSRGGRAAPTRRKPILPPQVAERMVKLIAHAFAGEVSMSAANHRRLMQVIRPYEAILAPALCRQSETLPDGTIRLQVQRNIGFHDAHLGPNKWTIPVDYDLKSGVWTSEIAAGQPGFDRLCAHVWRIQGRSEGMATRDLLAFVGAAYLASLEAGDVR